MTIRFLTQWNGYNDQSVASLESSLEASRVSGGIATYAIGPVRSSSVTNVVVSPSNTAAQNTALIQAALYAGGDIYIDGSGVILLDTRLVINSKSRIVFNQSIELKPSQSIGNLIVNKSWTLTPVSCAATWAGISGI